MKTYHPPSGLNRGLDLLISAEWTTDQAWAVVELLDDLRDRIWAHYEMQLVERLRDERVTRTSPPPVKDGEPPF